MTLGPTGQRVQPLGHSQLPPEMGLAGEAPHCETHPKTRAVQGLLSLDRAKTSPQSSRGGGRSAERAHQKAPSELNASFLSPLQMKDSYLILDEYVSISHEL